MRMLLALLLVIAAGIGAIYQATDGYAVVTTEAARRLSIAHSARELPATTIELTSARKLSLADELRQDGRVVIVDFIYTRCTSLCSIQGNEFQKLQSTIQADGLQKQIRLLSISFDAHDQPAQLTAYAKQMKADPALWQFVGIPNSVERQALLDSVGITVIPAPLGEFQHNAAYHVITPDGKLTRIVDYDEPRLALKLARDISGGLNSGITAVGQAPVAAPVAGRS